MSATRRTGLGSLSQTDETLVSVTEARLSTRKGKIVEWTNVHRYELAPHGEGCRIFYTVQIVRISKLPGEMAMLKVPGLRTLGLKMSASYLRRGVRDLARLAQKRAGGR